MYPAFTFQTMYLFGGKDVFLFHLIYIYIYMWWGFFWCFFCFVFGWLVVVFCGGGGFGGWGGGVFGVF